MMFSRNSRLVKTWKKIYILPFSSAFTHISSRSLDVRGRGCKLKFHFPVSYSPETKSKNFLNKKKYCKTKANFFLSQHRYFVSASRWSRKNLAFVLQYFFFLVQKFVSFSFWCLVNYSTKHDFLDYDVKKTGGWVGIGVKKNGETSGVGVSIWKNTGSPGYGVWLESTVNPVDPGFCKNVKTKQTLFFRNLIQRNNKIK